MTEILSSLETSIQQKLEADTDFQTSLTDLSDEDKQTAIQTKKSELLETEVASLKEKADKATKAEEIAFNQRIRAEKAEKELKNSKPAGESTPKQDGLSLKDVRALNGVHDDDVDFITNWAKANNVEIADAVKNSDVQLILKGHEEQRKIADATNTGTSKRSSAKLADDVLLSNASKGILPDSDEDLARLIVLRKPKSRS